LHGVRVLVLVDHEVVPALPQRLTYALVVAQQPDGEQQQVVEVDGAARTQRLLVTRVGICSQHRIVVRTVAARGLRRDQLHGVAGRQAPCLPVGDLPDDTLQV